MDDTDRLNWMIKRQAKVSYEIETMGSKLIYRCHYVTNEGDTESGPECEDPYDALDEAILTDPDEAPTPAQKEV